MLFSEYLHGWDHLIRIKLEHDSRVQMGFIHGEKKNRDRESRAIVPLRARENLHSVYICIFVIEFRSWGALA
jgi:hypothetical protein